MNKNQFTNTQSSSSLARPPLGNRDKTKLARSNSVTKLPTLNSSSKVLGNNKENAAPKTTKAERNSFGYRSRSHSFSKLLPPKQPVIAQTESEVAVPQDDHSEPNGPVVDLVKPVVAEATSEVAESEEHSEPNGAEVGPTKNDQLQVVMDAKGETPPVEIKIEAPLPSIENAVVEEAKTAADGKDAEVEMAVDTTMITPSNVDDFNATTAVEEFVDAQTFLAALDPEDPANTSAVSAATTEYFPASEGRRSPGGNDSLESDITDNSPQLKSELEGHATPKPQIKLISDDEDADLLTPIAQPFGDRANEAVDQEVTVGGLVAALNDLHLVTEESRLGVVSDQKECLNPPETEDELQNKSAELLQELLCELDNYSTPPKTSAAELLTTELSPIPIKEEAGGHLPESDLGEAQIEEELPDVAVVENEKEPLKLPGKGAYILDWDNLEGAYPPEDPGMQQQQAQPKKPPVQKTGQQGPVANLAAQKAPANVSKTSPKSANTTVIENPATPPLSTAVVAPMPPPPMMMQSLLSEEEQRHAFGDDLEASTVTPTVEQPITAMGDELATNPREGLYDNSEQTPLEDDNSGGKLTRDNALYRTWTKSDIKAMKTASSRGAEGDSLPAASVVGDGKGTLHVKKPTFSQRQLMEVNAVSDPEQAATQQQQIASSSDDVTDRLKLQFKTTLLAKEREWAGRLEKAESERDRLAEELSRSRQEAESAKQNATEVSMAISEYETIINQLMGENEAYKTSGGGDLPKLTRERDQYLEDLKSVENSFTDLHRRYDKLRRSSEDYKTNEAKLKKTIEELHEKVKKSDDRFYRLKEHAEEKLVKANQEIERLAKARDTDTLSLRAQLKKRDLQVDTLEKNLETKSGEIRELTSICDELIAKADQNPTG